jgi:phosphate-selective porin OprO/OprP
LGINEAYLAWQDIPYLGTLYVGNVQTPVGLEGITSSRDLTFMEPASANDAFVPGIKAGVMLARPVLDGRGTWAVGMFANTLVADFGNVSDLASVMGRATFLPFYWSDGSSTTLLHLGLSQAIGFSGAETARFRARPESHLAPFTVDTGEISAGRAALTGLELAFVVGPLSLQGEMYHSFVDARTGGTPHFAGGYLYGSYVLTGESRPYDTATGVFARLRPRRDLSFRTGGFGAFEVALRYSHLDLNDAPVAGGRNHIVMAGLNWYLNTYAKLRFNYGYAALDGPLASGGLHIFQTRIELDF